MQVTTTSVGCLESVHFIIIIFETRLEDGLVEGASISQIAKRWLELYNISMAGTDKHTARNSLQRNWQSLPLLTYGRFKDISSKWQLTWGALITVIGHVCNERHGWLGVGNWDRAGSSIWHMQSF